MALRLMASDRPAPTGPATAVSVVTMVLAPVALFYALIHAAFNSGPTTGGAFIELDAAPTDPAASHEGSAETVTTVVVELYDDRITNAYYLVDELGHGMVVLAIMLLGLVALCVMLRRPFSRVVSGFLLLCSAFAATAYVAGPAAQDWAKRQVVQRDDLVVPPGLEILPVSGDWYAWHGLCGTVAVLTFAAALYVLHARYLTRAPYRQAQLS